MLALLGVFLAGLGGCAHAPSLSEPPSVVAVALEKAGLPAHTLAAAVLPLDGRGSAALLLQAARPMQPASAMKVVTSAVALDRIGPNVRSSTELRAAAPIVEGRLRGDLLLRGGADPELGLPQLWALMLELREQGLREIEGDVVLDRSLFTPARMDIGVPPFDESPEFPYNVIPDALQFAGNLQVLELDSDSTTVRARLVPQLPGVVVDNRLSVHAAGTVPCRQWSERGWKVPRSELQPDGSVRLVLEGAFPDNCRQRQPLALLERNLQAQAQLRWLWRELGVNWTGRVREARSGEFEGMRVLARREARPWGELLRPLNKTSDNVTTRLLYLLTGLEESRRPGAAVPGTGRTLDWADASVRRWFAEQGIPTEGLVMDNGSGLSRAERITPMQLALVLRAAQSRLFAAELMMSLPIAGVDGSLRNRMNETPATGRARLKPGTLRNAVALAGYVQDRQGRWWVMAAMVNHDEAPQRGRPVLDAIANWVADGRP